MYAKDTIRINHPNEGVTSGFKCQQGVKQGCPLSPLLFGLYLDALEGCLDGKEFNALAPIDVHVWMLLFVNDVGIKGGIIAIVKHALAILCETWTFSEREKINKSWCSILLTHAKSLCLKVTLLSVCRPSKT
jgi:hypothetical protein